MDNIEQALFSLKADSTDSDIDRVLTIISKRMSEEDPNFEEKKEDYRKALSDIITFSIKQQRRLEALESYADSINLNRILSYLEINVNNQSTAIIAMLRHDINWFKTTALSIDGKKQVAASLINLCEKYGKTSNPFWYALVNNDLETFDLVSYTYIQDNT